MAQFVDSNIVEFLHSPLRALLVVDQTLTLRLVYASVSLNFHILSQDSCPLTLHTRHKIYSCRGLSITVFPV